MKRNNSISNAKWNPINNPIYGPIRAAKLKKERRAKAEAWLIENGHANVLPDVVNAASFGRGHSSAGCGSSEGLLLVRGAGSGREDAVRLAGGVRG